MENFGAFEEKKVDFKVVKVSSRSFKNHIILAALFTNKTALLYEYDSKWSVVLIRGIGTAFRQTSRAVVA